MKKTLLILAAALSGALAASAQTGRDIPYRDLSVTDYAAALVGAGLPHDLSDAIAGWDADAAQDALCRTRSSLRPLRLSGVMKVAEGLTTLDEVLRNTPQWEA